MSRRQDTLTRAERVRQRRKQQKQAPQQTRRAAGRRTAPRRSKAKGTARTRAAEVGTPVVVSRYGVVAGAAVQPTASVRRQVRVARGRNAEVVASVPNVALGWRWLSLALSIILILFLFALWYAPAFRVDMPQIEGLHYLSTEQVAAALPVLDRPVVAINPAQLQTDLLARFPALAEVHVRVGFPNHIVIEAHERQPVLVWQMGQKVWWVDAQGKAFAPLAEKAPEGTLVVKAAEAPPDATELQVGLMQLLSAEQVQSLRALAQYVPAGTTLVYHPRYGIGWQAAEGWQVYVGRDLADMDKRLMLYQAIADWLKAQGIHPALVSVASLQAPYYRLEP